jgi:hypothetical protein
MEMTDKEIRELEHGANVLEIVDTDDWGVYVDKQSVCVYTGYSDVEVKSLKIIE